MKTSLRGQHSLRYPWGSAAELYLTPGSSGQMVMAVGGLSLVIGGIGAKGLLSIVLPAIEKAIYPHRITEGWSPERGPVKSIATTPVGAALNGDPHAVYQRDLPTRYTLADEQRLLEVSAQEGAAFRQFTAPPYTLIEPPGR